MAMHRAVRFLGVAAVFVFTWLVLQVFRSSGGGAGGKIAKMDKDPLMDSELPTDDKNFVGTI